MADKVWQLPQATPLDPSATYDGLRLHEVVLRFPFGAPSGGELQVARLRDGSTMLQQVVTVPLEPGEPETIREALEIFAQAILARAGLLAEGSTLTVVAPPAPPEPSLGEIGTLR